MASPPDELGASAAVYQSIMRDNASYTVHLFRDHRHNCVRVVVEVDAAGHSRTSVHSAGGAITALNLLGEIGRALEDQSKK